MARRTNACSILGQETSFADELPEHNRRPLVLLWGDSTAGALMPGLVKAQQTHDFGHRTIHRQLLHRRHSMPIFRGAPTAASITTGSLAIARQLQPDIVLLHGDLGSAS